MVGNAVAGIPAIARGSRLMLQIRRPAQHGMRFANANQMPCETEERPVRPQLIPIKIVDLAVMTVAIVVTAFAVSDFVAHQQHRHALTYHQQAEEILHLPLAQVVDRSGHC